MDANDTKQITKELHAATTALGKARKSHQEATESRRQLRASWLHHLEESAKAWESQLEHFKSNMAMLQEQEDKAVQEVAMAQKTIQQLNAQGAKDQILEEQPSTETIDPAARVDSLCVTLRVHPACVQLWEEFRAFFDARVTLRGDFEHWHTVSPFPHYV